MSVLIIKIKKTNFIISAFVIYLPKPIHKILMFFKDLSYKNIIDQLHIPLKLGLLRFL